MRQTLLWGLGGVLLGGIIHIAAIFWIPEISESSAWSRLAPLGPVHTVYQIGPADGPDRPIANMDPNLRYAVCRYDLADGPLQINASIPLTYWSVSLYNRKGVNYYVVNDRVVGGRDIELWVATKRQLLILQPEDPEGDEAADGNGGEDDADENERLIIGAPSQQGFAIFRALVPETSFEDMVAQALQNTSCRPISALEQKPAAGR